MLLHNDRPFLLITVNYRRYLVVSIFRGLCNEIFSASSVILRPMLSRLSDEVPVSHSPMVRRW
jgi:hypothetical protein